MSDLRIIKIIDYYYIITWKSYSLQKIYTRENISEFTYGWKQDAY